MNSMLQHKDSPYIRCTGALYLRYAAEPSSLHRWFEPYLFDEEPVQIAASPQTPESTVGAYIRTLLTDMNYFGTLLPRLPVHLERDIKVKLLQAEEILNRSDAHLKSKEVMTYLTTIGNPIQALYGDEENPTSWYDAVVDRVIRRDDDTGELYQKPRFIVTFPEYGNTEQVTLGQIDLPPHHPLERSYASYGRPHDTPRNSSSESSPNRVFMERVRREQRESITVSKGQRYGRRPPTFKGSLALGAAAEDESRKRKGAASPPSPPVHDNKAAPASPSPPRRREKTLDEIRAMEDKRRKLMERYG